MIGGTEKNGRFCGNEAKTKNLSYKSIRTQLEMLKVVMDQAEVGRKVESFKPEFKVYRKRNKNPKPSAGFRSDLQLPVIQRMNTIQESYKNSVG